MALIKCTGCGHDVSDKATECPHCGHPISQENGSVCKECGIQLPKDATVCPNCGCPTDNTKAVKIVYYDEEPPTKKKKRWIWALVVALLCLIGGGYYAYTKLFNGGSDKNVIVELTPEFVNAIQKYDRLGVFNEGLAAVCKDGKWGYINTKGEEVIPLSIDADCVGRFSEGYAFVLQSPEMFSVIDIKGKTVFTSKFKIGLDAISHESVDMPYFIEEKLYVPFFDETGEVKFAIYDKDGKKTHNVSNAVGIDYYKQNELGDYTTFNEEREDANGYPDIQRGVKDAKGNIIIAAKYDYVLSHSPFDTDWLDNDFKHKISNGVVLVAILEQNANSPLSHGGVVSHYAYADLKGNDTFTDDVRKKCADSKKFEEENENDNVNGDFSESEWEDIQAQRMHDRAMQYDEESEYNNTYSSNNSSSNNRSSISELSKYDEQIAEYSPIMEETYQRFLRDVRSGGYTTITPPSSYYELSNACTSVGAAANQARRLCIKNGDTEGEQRYERIWKREQQLYNSAYNIMGNLH